MDRTYESDSAGSDDFEIHYVCALCESTGKKLSACGGCCTRNRDWDYLYCGRECQRKHWKKHKPFCGAIDTDLPFWSTPGIPVRIVKRPDGFGRLGLIAVVSRNEEHLRQLESVHMQVEHSKEKERNRSIVYPCSKWAPVTVPIQHPERIKWHLAETVFDGQKHCAFTNDLPEVQVQHLLARPEIVQVGSLKQRSLKGESVTVPIVEVSRFGRGTPNTT